MSLIFCAVCFTIYFYFLQIFIVTFIKTKNPILLAFLILMGVFIILYLIHFFVLYWIKGRDTLKDNPAVPILYGDLSSHQTPGHEGISIQNNLLLTTPFDKYSVLPGYSDYINIRGSSMNITTVGLITNTLTNYQSNLEDKMLDALSQEIDNNSSSEYIQQNAAPNQRIKTFCKIIEINSPEFHELTELFENVLGTNNHLVLQNKSVYYILGCFSKDENYFLISGLIASVESEDSLIINEFAIKQNYLYEGIEEELIEYLHLIASNHGFKKIIAKVKNNNISYYKKIGYYQVANQSSKEGLITMLKLLP